MEQGMEKLLDIFTGFWRAKTLMVGLELNVFSIIDKEEKSVEEIAQECKANPEAIGRLMIALRAMELVEANEEKYICSPIAQKYLVKGQPEWLGWFSRHMNGFLYPLWGELAKAVRENRNQRITVFGDDRSWFDFLYTKDEDVQDFAEFLGIFSKHFAESIVLEFDFSRYQSFLDIGSGVGYLPRAVANKYPDLNIAILELPALAKVVQEKFDKEFDMPGRIKVIAGNMMENSIPRGEYDLIHMGWTLHDFNPERQIDILTNIYQSLPHGGTFIASETPLNDDRTGPLFTALLSLNMLVSTDGGVESTNNEYIERFKKAGFSSVEVSSDVGGRKLIIGRKM
jgi:4-hydroxy-2,2'-bipyrrole-5-carbaldehyde O-methyltransferase